MDVAHIFNLWILIISCPQALLGSMLSRILSVSFSVKSIFDREFLLKVKIFVKEQCLP